MRHLYVVTYDICDPKRWRKAFKTMKGFGEHLQLSVFQCDLTERDLVDLTYRLGRQLDHREDQALIMDLGPTEGRPIKSIQYVGRPMTVVHRGPTIV